MLFLLIAALTVLSASASLSVASKFNSSDPLGFCQFNVFDNGTMNYFTFGGDFNQTTLGTSRSPTSIPVYRTKFGAKGSYDVVLQTMSNYDNSRTTSFVLKYQVGDDVATISAKYDQRTGISSKYTDFDGEAKTLYTTYTDLNACSGIPCNNVPISIANGALQVMHVHDMIVPEERIYFKTFEGQFLFYKISVFDNADGTNETDTPANLHKIVGFEFDVSDSFVSQSGGVQTGVCFEGL